ncbi:MULTISPECIES: EamA family transporter [unclassified Nostoc]|uniref:EamA family transporter n=1 Tax=unclassified Nostoc TaxID=2593658 RepID=UPI000DECFFD8|nr:MULTISPECIES: EamA family transporter [unclassified Nostoc]QHG16691.1 EamA family transporter [Nostoc sp. ATCC 53789]QLE49462.1 multidrug resistance protein [Nostoc sp. C057]RCJ35565.1 multidrug resistance protein [Nostoc sp. ATCC 53789]
MNIITWLLLIVVVLFGTTANISLKYGLHISSPTKGASTSILNLLLSRYFWIWFICYTFMTVLWLYVLRTIPLSQAFPVLGLMYALIPIASHYLLKERVVFSQWLGISIIITGVVLVVN